MIILIFIITILISLFFFINNSDINYEMFNDSLQIPDNGYTINEINTGKYNRLSGIEKHVKIDKYDRIEKITYQKPQKELGETECNKVNCPYWLNEVICWKCK